MTKKMTTQLFTTLVEAIEWVKLNRPDGCICPCCEQFIKIYKRRLNAGMAYELLQLYILDKYKGVAYYHHSLFTKRSIGEISKLVHWGLVEQEEKDEEDTEKRTSGSWAITQAGRDFVDNKIKVKSHVYLLNGKILGFSDTETDILESLGEKFDYEELMRGTV